MLEYAMPPKSKPSIAASPRPLQRYGLSSKITPQIHVQRIVVELRENQPPTVTLHGRVYTGRARIDNNTAVMIKTTEIDAQAQALIESAKATFRAAVEPAEE